MWEVLIGSGPVMILLLFWPETSSSTILYRRAACLRKVTGDERIRSAAEIAHAGLHLSDVVRESLLVPARLTVQDPAILFANVYMMLVYGIFYSFFESFPLIYEPMYAFNYLQKSLAFLPLAVGTIAAACCNAAFLYFYRVRWHATVWSESMQMITHLTLASSGALWSSYVTRTGACSGYGDLLPYSYRPVYVWMVSKSCCALDCFNDWGRSLRIWGLLHLSGYFSVLAQVIPPICRKFICCG